MPHHVVGVDFTSAPTSRKPIKVAHGELTSHRLLISRIDHLFDFAAFDALLGEPGPWICAFDLPFGLPRELAVALNWPTRWQDIVAHVENIGKGAFKNALNRIRESRPMGSRYIPRSGDAAAGSSSPMKLVNPPVGLMFFEGAPRIARAGLSVIPCMPSEDSRVAVEAYPGFLARQFTKTSYKKDGPEGRSASRQSNREMIVNALANASTATAGLSVVLPDALRRMCVDDGSGDALDAVLCATQAAMTLRTYLAGDPCYGMPKNADPLEGWIATVPAS